MLQKWFESRVWCRTLRNRAFPCSSTQLPQLTVKAFCWVCGTLVHGTTTTFWRQIRTHLCGHCSYSSNISITETLIKTINFSTQWLLHVCSRLSRSFEKCPVSTEPLGSPFVWYCSLELQLHAAKREDATPAMCFVRVNLSQAPQHASEWMYKNCNLNMGTSQG